METSGHLELVWRRSAHGGDRVEYCGLVSQRHAASANPLGLDP